MSKAYLFDWLVEYHATRNLPSCLSHVQSGVVTNARGEPMKEATEENEHYKGFLIVANGTTLVDKLIDDGEINQEDVVGFEPVPTKEALFDYLDRQVANDGAFIYDGINHRITRVLEINNRPQARTKIDYSRALPPDFVSADGSLPPEKYLGTKTRLAVKWAQAYEGIETFQVKRTAFGSFGMGKVTHFDSDGLVQEFFIVPDPVQDLACQSSPALLGIHRSYDRSQSNNHQMQHTFPIEHCYNSGKQPYEQPQASLMQ